MEKIHLRFIAITAGAALIIALLIGLFSGVGFGSVLLKSLLSGIIFGGLAFGIDFVARKFLPELFSSNFESDDSENADNEIDIPEPIADGTPNINIVLDEENPHAAAKPQDDDGDFVEEIKAVNDDEGNISEALPEGAVSDVEEIEDDLPSLDQFSSSFADGVGDTIESSNGAGPNSGSKSLGGAKSEAVDIMGDEHSPADVARAVQTLLAKDEKG